MSKKFTTEEFIERAKQVHGDKYDYSKVEYVNAHTKIIITCPQHGDFLQVPNSHLNGTGCPYCKIDKLKQQNTSSTKEFIAKAKQVHGDKYDYSKVEYKHKDIKIKIICPEHGEFLQTPHNHLSGRGCPECKKETLRAQRSSNTKEFIAKAKELHGDKYDYSKVDYINNRTKVCIICPEHGEFWQTPNCHLDGKGCPVCKKSHGEKKIEMFLKEHNIKYESQKKFKDCKNKKLLPFDFYLPDYNLCIEFQGRQHFEPIDHFKGESGFKQRIKNDAIKKEWCAKEENPNLLEICSENDIFNLLDKIILEEKYE